MVILTFISLIAIFPLSWGLCGLVRKYTLKKAILDIPNDRSSHTIPTPRGGGLTIVVVFLLFMIFMLLCRMVSQNVFLALFGGGFLVALMGWLDDCKVVVSMRLRLLVHFGAACWALYWLRGFPQLNLGFVSLHWGLLGTLPAVLGIVWVTNLYNFMDGIDGLAGIESVSVGAVAGFLLLAAGFSSLAFLSFGLALSSLGFLIWNWPKAKIFMGDTGSGFLGFILATMAVASENSHHLPLLIWAILLGIFLVDATATLIRRIYHKEHWYEAHRSHAYQYAVQNGFTHKQVTLTVLFINIAMSLYAWLAWLLPHCMLVVFGGVYLMLLTLYITICRNYNLHLIFGNRQLIDLKNNLKNN